MHRLAVFITCVTAICCASIASAQQDKLNDRIQENLLLEQKGQYREAYLEWQKFLAIPTISGRNLTDPAVQKIFYPAYFYYTRTCYKMALHDPKIMNRQKFIHSAATMLIKLEKTKEAWVIVEPMVHELLKEKDSEQLKKSYDALRPAPAKKGSSLSDPRRDGPNPWRTASVCVPTPETRLHAARWCRFENNVL